MTIAETHNGHFLSRKYWRFRWERINTEPSCRYCNCDRDKTEMEQIFEAFLRKKHGDEIIDKMIQSKNDFCKEPTVDELQIILADM